MNIVDSHVHVWDPSTFRYDWLADEPALNRVFLPTDIGPANRADRMVFVQADCAAASGLDEARWVSSMADDWPELSGIVAFAPLGDSADVRPYLSELAAIPRIVGVRRLLQDEPLEFVRRQELVDGLRAVASSGLVFDACVRHDQLDALAEVIDSVPELAVVLDHLGKPPVARAEPAEFADWLGSIRRLAANPNVNVKLSGLAPESAPDRAIVTQAMPYLRAALDAFGPDRCLVGSDFPVSFHAPRTLEYGEWFDIVLNQTGLDDRERTAVAETTASRVYGLPETTPSITTSEKE